MGEIRVRNIDDEVVAALKDRARRHGNSLGAEIRDMLVREALRPRQELAERLQAHRNRIRTEVGEMPDSTAFIRAERDKRG